MLKEYQNVRQVKGESKRRWFTDEYFDLIVWLDEQDHIVGFQLCYDIERHQHALTWHQDSGYTHHRVDDGENRLGKLKSSPILMPDGLFHPHSIAAKFQRASRKIEERIATFVYTKILEYV